jgi:hypothetical protein
MNTLASMKSKLAVIEYITWASDINLNTRSSALIALACSASPAALPVLMKEAKAVLYMVGSSGATASFLTMPKMSEIRRPEDYGQDLQLGDG